jgi:hypothetical protein
MSGDTRDSDGAQGAIDTRSLTKPESAVEGRDETRGEAFRSPDVPQPETLQPTELANPESDLERSAQPGRLRPTPF